MMLQKTCSMAGLLAAMALATTPARAATAPATAAAAGREAVADNGPDIARYLRVRTPSRPVLAPDGSIYVRDWPDGVFQLYRRGPDEGPEQTGTRLTDFADGIAGFSVAPDGSRVLITANTGGSEQNDIYVLDAKTSEVTPLYVDPDVVYSPQVWLADSSGFVFTANDESSSDFFMYGHSFLTGQRTRLLAKEGSWYAADITEDGSRLLIGRYFSASSAEVFVLEGDGTGTLTDLTMRDADGTALFNSPAGFLPGAGGVLIASDRDDGRRNLFEVPLDGSGPRKLLPALDAFDLDDAVISRDRDTLAVVSNQDGFGVLSLFALPGFAPIAGPALPAGITGVQQFEADTLVYSLSNAQTPGLSFAWTPGAEPRQLTFTNDQGFDFSTFRAPALVKYTSFDGIEIPAFLYLPPDAAPGRPVPFIVDFHGGPEGQHRPGFSAVNQYFLDAGFGVLEPNVRGSTGYGRAFHQMDNYQKRWDSVKDGVAAASWLVEQGYALPGRIASMGGSYGGFMASAVPIEDTRQAEELGEPNLFGASINVVGIVNFRTFLEQTRDYRRKLREAEYGPLSDPEFLASVSPLTHAEQIRIPMLIAHGLNDPRVPVGEAMQLAVHLQTRALEDPAMQPELLFFPDEGHGFAKLANRLLYYRTVVSFLDRHIGAPIEATPPTDLER